MYRNGIPHTKIHRTNINCKTLNSQNTNTALLFGSFNPIHIGHLALANYILEFAGFDELWFVVSPGNPFKEASELIDETHRLNMVKLAVVAEPRFRVSDIEFDMPRPSYTIDTLDRLKQLYTNNRFSLIMGADNLLSIDRWKEPARLTSDFDILVYPRPGYTSPEPGSFPKTKIIQAPQFDISATLIRDAIKQEKKIPYLLPHGVYDYILKNSLYK
jgi:nicotinate-nucleotide adenylyltransferase